MTQTSFQGEVQFRRYSDTSSQGQQVVFAVADREALEAFIGKEGRRFMAVLVEIGDDEQPVQQPKEKIGPICREAIDLCSNPEFQLWVNPIHPSSLDAKARILAFCGVTSRRELDESTGARVAFIKRIRVPFMKRNERQAA